MGGDFITFTDENGNVAGFLGGTATAGELLLQGNQQLRLDVSGGGDLVLDDTINVIRPESSGGAQIGAIGNEISFVIQNVAALTDGISAPATVSGLAQLYVDTSDGDLKVKFGDGTVKTIATDT